MSALGQKPTCAVPMAAKCQKRTLRLLDDLIGCGEQRLRNGQAERTGRSAGFSPFRMRSI